MGLAREAAIWAAVVVIGVLDARAKRSDTWITYVNVDRPLDGVISLVLAHIIMRVLIWICAKLCCVKSRKPKRQTRQPERSAIARSGPQQKHGAGLAEFTRACFSEIEAQHRSTGHWWFDTSHHRPEWNRYIADAYFSGNSFNPHAAARMIHQ